MASSVTPHEDPHDGFHVTIDPKHQEPLPAIVVADDRNTLGKRLGLLGIGLLALFFIIAAYKQAVSNGHRQLPKSPSVSVTIQPDGRPSPVQILTPYPVPTVVIVASPLPGGTPAPSPRASGAPQPSASPRRSPSAAPRPSPSQTCLLPGPVPCLIPIR